MSVLKTGTNFGELKKIVNLSALKKKNEVQNPRRILHTALYCANAYAEIGHASREAVKWWSQFSLQHGLAASVGIVLGKAECCRQSLGTLWRSLRKS